MSDDSAAKVAYNVVVNEDGEYSIWRSGMPVPAGWHRSGYEGTETDCVAHIDRVWTDMRPLSLRRAMEGTPPGGQTRDADAAEGETDGSS